MSLFRVVPVRFGTALTCLASVAEEIGCTICVVWHAKGSASDERIFTRLASLARVKLVACACWTGYTTSGTSALVATKTIWASLTERWRAVVEAEIRACCTSASTITVGARSRRTRAYWKTFVSPNARPKPFRTGLAGEGCALAKITLLAGHPP